MSRRPLAKLFIAVSLASACAQAAPEPPVLVRQPLVEHTLWSRYGASDDSLASHQPTQIRCGPGGFYVEREQLEIDSAYCNYVMVEQPALIALEVGTEVSLELSHFDLSATEPARAHAALLFDRQVVWETFIDIPGQANVLQVSFPAPQRLERNTPVRFHLHNHGQNTYALGPIEAGVPCERDCARDH